MAPTYQLTHNSTSEFPSPPSNPDSSSHDAVTNIVFGICAIIASIIMIWQAHKAYNTWYRGSHGPSQERKRLYLKPVPDPCTDLQFWFSDSEMELHELQYPPSRDTVGSSDIPGGLTAASSRERSPSQVSGHPSD